MPANDLSLLIKAAQRAGDIALGYAGETAIRWDKPDDAGPVTEADLAVNDALLSDLLGARPDYGWLSEETEDGADRLGRDRVFIIDPIDGTRSFIEGSRTWAHSIAVAQQGQVTAAVIYLPMRDMLFAAAAGQGATLNGVTLRASGRDDLDGADVLAARPATEARHWKTGQVPGFKRAHRPSLAYRLAVVAQGQFDAMLTLRKSWEWDIAAGDLILREAGAAITDRTGQGLIFNNSVPQLNGVVAGTPLVHRRLIEALA